MNLSLSGFKSCHVLVVGDIMLDRYFWGNVDRISPEAPVPVVKLHQRSETLGGAGNVAYNLAALECGVTLIGICGNDQTANQLRNMFQENNIRYRLVEDANRPSITKTRVMAHKQQVLRLDEEDPKPVAAEILAQIKTAVLKEMPDCQAFLLEQPF